MINADKSVTRPIVVLGSKPSAALPMVAAPYVCTANNAVELGVLYRQKYGAKIIALVPAEELRNRSHIQDSFIKSQPDEIVVLSGVEADRAFVQNLGLRDSLITIYSFRERNQLMMRALGFRVALVILERLWFRGIRYAVQKVRHHLLDGVSDTSKP